MKNKGFTLIELLAVIVILAIIALIATPIILNIIDNTKESSKERSKELYLDAVANTIAAYNMKNPMVDLSNAKCDIVTEDDESNDVEVGDLSCKQNEDAKAIYIKVEMDGEKPKSGSITFVNGKIETESVSLEETNGVGGSTGDDGGSSEITLASLCGKPISYTTEGELTVGDKYSCDFGTGARNFYILELGSNPVTGTKLESDEVALILEGNYDTTTQSWCDQEGENPSHNRCAADGLNEKLEEIRDAWTELEDIREKIILPSAEQVARAAGQDYHDMPKLSSTNAWLYNWPDNANYGSSAPYGYWTSTPCSEYTYYAWYVTWIGYVYLNEGTDVEWDKDFGVRPVVNLKIK